MTVAADFKTIKLTEIHPDPNQPRKFYDEQAMEELVQSIEHKGVLSPILVRPNGKGYILVCGERRYRASKTAGLNEIPAVIRTLTDAEALELQIIENLQRKDVHPMEEAVAFKSLIDHKQLDVKEIAARIGKKEYYVKQRLKLNDLTKDWQDAFFHNHISLNNVLKVVFLEKKQQEQLYKEEGYRKPIELSDWSLRKYRGELMKASFDLADPFLDKKAGPCTDCKFNTAVALLFPEHASSPRCMNVSCFTNKTGNYFNAALKNAKEDPAIIFLENSWSPSTNDKFINAIRKEGFDVLNNARYSKVDVPEKPDWEDFRENNEDDYDNSDDLKKAFDDELLHYEGEMKTYQAKIANSKYKKAFMLDGDDKGKYVYIEMRKSSGSSSAKAAAVKKDVDELTTTEIEAEIDRIKEKEKRSKQIDENKIWDELKKHFNPSGNSKLLSGTFTQVERNAIAGALSKKLDYTTSNQFEKQFADFIQKDDQFINVDDATLRKMMRFFMLSELPPSMLYSGWTNDHEAKMCLAVADEYFPSVKNEIVQSISEKAAVRSDRVNKKIKELQDQKKLLQAQAKQPAKKAVKK